jgi:hypothetical protein
MRCCLVGFKFIAVPAPQINQFYVAGNINGPEVYVTNGMGGTIGGATDVTITGAGLAPLSVAADVAKHLRVPCRLIRRIQIHGRRDE